MTIRRKLGVASGLILLLFGLNLAFYFATRAKRNEVVDALARAIKRQTLISNISQRLLSVHQQVTLFSGINAEEGTGGLTPDQKRDLSAQLDDVSSDLFQLEGLVDPGERPEIHKVQETFAQLAKSWKTYFQNYGSNPNLAVMELALRGDPLSEEVLKTQVPYLQRLEKEEITQAEAEFSRVSRINDRTTVIILLLSLLVAFSIAVRFSRGLVRAIGDLILGTAHLTAGNLDHRITEGSDDEIGQLARSFNAMATSLGVAQDEVRHHTEKLEQTNNELANKNEEIQRQKHFSEKLLLNILPVSVAEELKSSGSVSPKYFEDVTILFTDFVGFTKIAEKISVEDLVYLLHHFFTSFDQVVKRYNLEKLKTIGDSYMCAGGIPIKTSSHPIDAVLAAFDIVDVVGSSNQRIPYPFSIRIGIHTGPVAAGVVGIDKFAFDVWGDTVNFAARLQTASQANRINISATTYNRVKDFFNCEYRGQIETKEKKTFDMFFANGVHPDLQNGDASGFDRRYKIYFSKNAPALPSSLLNRATKVLG